MLVQEKLKNGVRDQETEKIMETALLAKNLLGKKKKIPINKTREKSVVLLSSKNTNETQNLNISRQIVEQTGKPANLLDKIEKNLESTRIFIKKMEKCKETVKDPSKLLEKMEKLNQDKNPETKQDVGLDKKSEINQEIFPYFQSLNKIEDTIKFLETNLKETKEIPKIPVASPQFSSFLSPENKTLLGLTCKNSTFSKDLRTLSVSPETQTKNNFKKSELFEKNEVSDKKTEKSAIIEDKEEKENIPISFDVTAKSKSFDGDQSLRDSIFNSLLLKPNEIQINKINPEMFFKNLGNSPDQEEKEWEESNEKPKKSLFLEQDFNNESSEKIEKMGFFSKEIKKSEDKAKKTNLVKNEQIKEFVDKPKKVIFSEIEGKKMKSHSVVEAEEEDVMIDKIKNMLENTKNELTKMNEINFNFPNYQIIGSDENKENSKVFFENVSNKSKIEGKKIQVEPVLKPLNSNISVKVNNNMKTNNLNFMKVYEEDEMPMPMPRNNRIKPEEKEWEINEIIRDDVRNNKKNNSLNIKHFLK